MNSIHPPHTTSMTSSFSATKTIGIDLLSAVTWIVALIFTLCTITLRLSLAVIRTTIRYALKWSVYLLLGTLFLCGAVILLALSIVSLGAISLP